MSPEQVEGKDVLKYYSMAKEEAGRKVEEFNRWIVGFWLKYDLYPVINTAYSPLDFENNPVPKHVNLRRLDVLQNPTKLLVNPEKEKGGEDAKEGA